MRIRDDITMRMLTMILVTENTPEIAPSGDDNDVGEEAAAASPRTPKISKKKETPPPRLQK